MMDKHFLIWLHNRLVHQHGENIAFDYMYRFRAIINALPNDQLTPINESLDGVDKIKTYITTYVTFGQVHKHNLNGEIFDKDCVAVIKGPSIKYGRDKAFKLFGRKFFTTYIDTTIKDMDSFLSHFPRGLINVE